MSYYELDEGIWQELLEMDRKARNKRRIIVAGISLIVVIYIIAIFASGQNALIVMEYGPIAIGVTVFLTLHIARKYYPSSTRKVAFFPGTLYEVEYGGQSVICSCSGSCRMYLDDECLVYKKRQNLIHMDLKLDYQDAVGRQIQAKLRVRFDIAPSRLTSRGAEVVSGYLLVGKSELRAKFKDWLQHCVAIQPNGDLFMRSDLLRNNPFGFEDVTLEAREFRLMSPQTLTIH